MRENKGITLIALVVTIIVLLILASISLNLVLGEHGIITMAKKAKENMELAQVEEQTTLNTLYEQLYGNSIGGSGNSGDSQGGETIPPNPSTTKSPIEQAKDDGKYFENETTLEDSDGNRVVVPAKFKIAEDSGKNVTEGIVIEDNDIQEDGNGQQRGNQYVWIPVSNIDGSGTNKIKKGNEEIEITLGRYEFADGTTTYKDNNGDSLGVLEEGKEILRQSGKEYESETVIEKYYKELKTYRAGKASNDATGLNRTAKDLKGFIDSVQKNGGYYIARYEASYGTDKKPNSKVSINQNNTDSAPIAEGYLWNNITQIKAAEACDNMYETLQSDLINSYAWDTAIVYIQKFSDDSDYSRQYPKGNHNIANTGKNGDEMCKINDMAFNCFEWTTEYSTLKNSSYAYPGVFRGGNFIYSNSWTCYRESYDYVATASEKCTTFRPILYLSSPES